MRTMNRRSLIRRAATLGGSVLVAPAFFRSFAIAADSHALAHTALGDDAHLLSTADANALCIGTTDGALLVDGVDAFHAQALVDAVKAHTGQAVSVLYNTHWHWEHTGANELIIGSGARAISHENTRLWLGAEFYADWQDRLYTRRPANALPTETFYETHAATIGGEVVECGYLPQAHTDGDIYVHLPNRKLLVAGGLVADHSFPQIDPATGGWIGGLVRAQAKLLELCDETTRIIPASGAVQSRAELLEQYEMLAEMKNRLYDMATKSMSPKEMLAANVAEGFESWGDPTQFVLNSYQGIWLHYKDIDGVL